MVVLSELKQRRHQLGSSRSIRRLLERHGGIHHAWDGSVRRRAFQPPQPPGLAARSPVDPAG
jgi:hypothetical protein